MIQTLQSEAGLTKSEASKAVSIFFSEMADALGNGDRVEIRGLCSVYVKKYKAYKGRNPRSGKNVKVKPKKLPFFKCGAELKKRVDNPDTSFPDQRNGEDRRYQDAKILEPDFRNGKDRRRN